MGAGRDAIQKGERVMLRKRVPLLLLSALVIAPGFASGAVMSFTDLWDVSQGTVVDSTTGVVATLSPANMLGADIHSSFGAGQTIFSDYRAAGYVHDVCWHTTSAVTVRSINLVMWHDASGRDYTYRGASQFDLYYKDDAGAWQLWYTLNPDPDGNHFYDGESNPNYPGQNYAEIETNVTPVTAQYFKATFVQAGGPSNASGPRVGELDAYSTFVPEPASALLLLVGGLALRRRCR